MDLLKETKKENPSPVLQDEKKPMRKKNGKNALLQAKHQLDKVIPFLSNHQDLRKETLGLREKLLNLYVEEERKVSEF